MRTAPAPIRLPDQRGRTWLVTGATNGVGREVAREAARAGARVLITARDTARGERTRTEIGAAQVVEVDLSSVASVLAAASRVREPLDVLVNNAGTVVPTRRESADGHELMLATNLLGPFALTTLLADRVRDRIVVVGSGAHEGARVDLADPHFRRRRWSIAAAYGQSKLADMLWALALDRRLRARGRDVAVQLAHPGWALTNLQNATGRPRLDGAITAACTPFAQPAPVAARSLLVAATADLPPVSYVGPGGWRGLRGEPALAGRSAAASNPALADAVWHLAARETGTDL
ncbi:SDR family NAD(P)-dependent oxidoreductase [Agilicoccus flavus]|uniref:SDR family NAD(P)-dependent oxidoreductase n=1 Tax=Agilicoccus flavus TaxID=2775968 RepID=UPI001CF71A93|nr:SDR family NAD(P)-dependent oxidoreductase [Agilicoccus flavus]